MNCTAQKMKFSIKDLVTFTEEILHKNFNFCGLLSKQVLYNFQPEILCDRKQLEAEVKNGVAYKITVRLGSSLKWL